MTRLLAPLLLIVSGLVITGRIEAQPCCNGGLPSHRDLARFGLERAWWSQATLNAATDRIVYLTADEENVYAQSKAGIVTAFDAETGKRLWYRLLGPTGAPSFPVVTNSEQLLLATGMNLFGVDKFTGRLLWRLNLPHHPTTSPGIGEVQAYIGTLDGSAYAFDLAAIRRLYEDQLLPEWTDNTVVWRFRAGGPVTSSPIAMGLNVNFPSEDGSLYSVALSNGSLHFQFETNGPINTPIGRSEDALFIAADDIRLFSINALDGKLRWTFVGGTPIRRPPQIVGQQVFVAPERSGLYSLATLSGRTQWHQPRAAEFLAASDELVFASDELGNLLLLSRVDGAVLGSIPLHCMTIRVNNDRTDRVFAATPEGIVVSIREAGSEFPSYHKFPERQPMLPEFGDDVEPTADSPSPEAPPVQ